MKDFSRRMFLKSATAATAGVIILPNLLSCTRSNKLNVALIGAGGRGEDNWEKLMNENIVAIADVDDNRAANAFKTFPKAKR